MNTGDYLDPILSGVDSRMFEERLFEGDESLEWKAMNQAGAAIAAQASLDLQEALENRPPKRILVLVGKGHNGGDALIATRHWLNKYADANAFLLFPLGLGHLRPLVQRSLDDLQVAHGSKLQYFSMRKGSVQAQLESWLGHDPVDLCLDGILGMRFKPPLRSPVKELIQYFNEKRDITCRIAVDVPSGLGDESDERAFCADFSYATGIAKAGLFTLNNHPKVGRIRYLDLGFFRKNSPASSRMIITDRVFGFRRRMRGAGTHKKKFGHLFVVGGSASMPGAILMTVRAALRSGVGLVTAFVPDTIAAQAAAQIPEAMWVGLPQIPEHGGLALEGLGQIRGFSSAATGWAIGPGMGRHPETETLIEEILSMSETPVLLDADALSPKLAKRDWSKRSCVITPHAGEFNRLLDRSLSEPIEEKTVLEYAEKVGWTTLLKGSPTLVADGETAVYSCFGGPVLARGGSGDLLSGLIGGRIAIPGTNFLGSILESVSWHGWAADRLARKQGQVAAKATDILSFLS